MCIPMDVEAKTPLLGKKDPETDMAALSAQHEFPQREGIEQYACATC